jgi:hypothetical protein
MESNAPGFRVPGAVEAIRTIVRPRNIQHFQVTTDGANQQSWTIPGSRGRLGFCTAIWNSATGELEECDKEFLELLGWPLRVVVQNGFNWHDFSPSLCAAEKDQDRLEAFSIHELYSEEERLQTAPGSPVVFQLCFVNAKNISKRIKVLARRQGNIDVWQVEECKNE